MLSRYIKKSRYEFSQRLDTQLSIFEIQVFLKYSGLYISSGRCSINNQYSCIFTCPCVIIKMPIHQLKLLGARIQIVGLCICIFGGQGLRFKYGVCGRVLGFSLGLVFFQATAKLECVSSLVVVTRFSLQVLNIIELLTLLNVELSASLSVESLSFGFRCY